MKCLLCLLTIIATTWAGAPANATVGSSTAFVESLGEAVVAILEDPSLSPAERIDRYSTEFEKAFDWDRISAFAIGRYQRGVTRNQFNAYRDLFAQHMMKIYAEKFASYSGERFLVKGERKFGRGGSEVTAILQGGAESEPVKLAFKLVQTGDTQRIYDVVINGVSLLVAKRAEMKGIIAARGIDGLIAQLKQANAS
ncbi:MAG: ABC transporter substrate-binding protein [Rhodospirillaceae bacterium]|nr:ABC transporter substrate-binding protein [Rhodospirillaceae bacterium]MDD9927716.1 ABC transporter substrate-binding protein [Rhodospirillaceae bacterium]